MPIERSKEKDYKPLSRATKGIADDRCDRRPLVPLHAGSEATTSEPQNLVNLSYNYGFDRQDDPAVFSSPPGGEPIVPAISIDDPEVGKPPQTGQESAAAEPSQSKAKKEKQVAKDTKLLQKDRWLLRNGHAVTFAGLYMFSVMVLFRPYEIVPGMGFLSGTAIYFALLTLAVYLPSQLATEGNITILPTEVKAVLAMTLIALFTVPIARDPGLAWETFNDSFIKAVVIFVVMVNVVRTRERLMKLLWLSFGIGIYLGVSALDLYMKGKFAVEEYRIAVDVGGMFGNPNEMAMHFVMMTPIAITLGIAAKSSLWRLIYFLTAALFVAANMVTFSRGGFLGLLACLAVLAWKLGRKHRFNVAAASVVVGGIAMIAAPGNYGLRMLSIFIPGLDAVGSSDQRQELLIRSIWVSLRNPWGIGIGNFPIVGVRNLQSHNAFTQVSAELGILGLIAYLVFMISPLRKLGAIERKLFDAEDHSWFYYLAIGLQASIVGYLVSSFFASVAYGWFIYYLIAYAVAFRRIYSIELESREKQGVAAAAQTA